jgi:hypothetical protein
LVEQVDVHVIAAAVIVVGTVGWLVEPTPGERFEVDWGHFGALDYSGDKRKL